MNRVRLVLGNIWSPDNIGDMAIARGIISALASIGIDNNEILGLSLFPRRHPNNKRLENTLGLQTVEGHPVFRFPDRFAGFIPRILRASRIPEEMLRRKILSFRKNPLKVMLATYPPGVVRILQSAKSFVIMGGSILFCKDPNRILLPHTESAVATAKLGKALGKNVVFGPQSFGPFVEGSESAYMLKVLDELDMILLRESISISEAFRCGINKTRFEFCPDAAWLIQPRMSARVKSDINSIPQGTKIGISLREPVGCEVAERRERLIDKAIKLCSMCVANQWVPVLVAHVTGPPPREDDRIILNCIIRHTPSNLKIKMIQTHGMTPEECLALYSCFSATVGMRFHFSLLSLMAKIPTVGIGYFTSKHKGTFTDLGLDNFVVDEHWSPLDIIAKLTLALKHKKDIEEKTIIYNSRHEGQLLKSLQKYI